MTRAGRTSAALREEGEPLDDVALVVRMRAGAPRAFEHYVERFHRVLLDYARRAGVDAHRRDEFVRDVLSDTALHFLAPGSPVPNNPRMYLIAAFRNKLLNGKRDRARREKALGGALREVALDSDYVDPGNAAAGCSEAAVRESRGPGWEHGSLPGPLARLSAHLSDALTADERQLLIAVAENVPQREIAEWLGVSHALARKRLERLRARLTEVAMQYTSSLPPDDARALEAFFRRCGARIRTGGVIAPREPTIGVCAGEPGHAVTGDPSAELRRGEDLLAALAMRAESRRPDSALYSDARVVAWLDKESGASERGRTGWSAESIRAAAAEILARATARQFKVRQQAGAPCLERARMPGTIPQILDDAVASRAAPQLELSAAAGAGRELWDEPCESWVELPEDVPPGRYIAVRIAGESMIPLLHTGDTILVRLGSTPARDTIVLARLGDGGYAVKRVGRISPVRLELLSLNPDFAPIVVPRDEHTVIGTVVLRWCPHSATPVALAG